MLDGRITNLSIGAALCAVLVVLEVGAVPYAVAQYAPPPPAAGQYPPAQYPATQYPAGQEPPPAGQEPPPAAPEGPPLAPQQLDDLVAPIALYPDPLLGEVLAAATYPMEIAEAEQWLQDHAGWKPSKLMDEAKKQNWDPSVQGLVAFPQVLARLTQDMGWTTALGNAFLSQQADVMQAVQRMRAQAEARGTLRSNPQEAVTTVNQGGQSAIDIEPVNPDIWYVPYYNPEYVWGPPVYGYYPPLVYPGISIGFDWGPGINLGLCFGGWGGWGWGGWGWMPNWYGGGIIINNSFFHRFGFRHFEGNAAFGHSAWVHNPGHRLGVPYPNRQVAARFGAEGRFSAPLRGGGVEQRGGGVEQRGGGMERGFSSRPGGGERAFRGSPQAAGRQPSRSFGTRQFEQRGWTNRHSVFGGYHNGAMTRAQSDHGFSSMGAQRAIRSGGSRGGGFHGGGGGVRRGSGGGRRR